MESLNFTFNITKENDSFEVIVYCTTFIPNRLISRHIGTRDAALMYIDNWNEYPITDDVKKCKLESIRMIREMQ
jgi:hypothetical protein